MNLLDLSIVDIVSQNKNVQIALDNHAIVLALDNIEVNVDNKHYEIDSSKLLFIEQNQGMSVLSNGSNYFIINFKGEIVSEIFKLNIVQKQDVLIGINDELRKTLFDMFSCYQKHNQINLYLLGLFYQVIHFIDEYISNNIVSLNENAHIKTAIKYMEIHYAQNIGIVDIASTCRLNPNYLTNLFQKEMKISPVQYLISIRMLHAKNLLLTRRYTLQEIGLRVGYKTASYLSQAFKKFYGISPKEFLINN